MVFTAIVSISAIDGIIFSVVLALVVAIQQTRDALE